MRALIRHLTEYHYPREAWDSFNELRLEPASGARQELLSFELTVAPQGAVQRRLDYFGTAVHHVEVAAPHLGLRLETRSLVVTHPPVPVPPTPHAALDNPQPEWLEFLLPSRRVPAGSDWPALFGWPPAQPHDDLPAYLDGLTRHLHARFRYTPGATRVDTPLLEFAGRGEGVCQDYAHAMIGVCRAVRIPARYVSGYVHAGTGSLGAEATHAWVEALVPGHGWLGLDPTNASRAGAGHVKVGHGRDYDDVPPVRGLRRGGGRERLEVEVSFTPEP